MSMIKYKLSILVCILFVAVFPVSANEEQSSTELTQQESTENNAILSIDDFKETISTDRPDFKASDYITLPEYIGISVTEGSTSYTTSADLEERVMSDCRRNGIEYTSIANLTDEDAAIITSQRYQTVDEYISAVLEQISLYSNFESKENTFLNLLSEIIDDIEFDSFPEEVYAYDMSDEQMYYYGLSKGFTYDDMDEILEEGTESYEYNDLVATREGELKVEEIIKYMADDLGIREPNDSSYDILMAKWGLFDYNDLYKYYSTDELLLELLYVNVARNVVAKADLKPITHYNTTGLPGDEIYEVTEDGEVLGVVGTVPYYTEEEESEE